MMFYLDILKHIIRSDYWEGLRVVPIILMSYLFQGIFFNLSLWYKLVDKTEFGAYFSLAGLAITLAINITFVPLFGYMASAAASFFCYLIMMVVSYFYGQKYYPIKYDLKSIGIYFIGAFVLFGASKIMNIQNDIVRYAINTLFLCLYIALIIKRDLPLKAIPFVNRFIK